jgi:hypothetical protein
MPLTNAKHIVSEIDGIRCTIVEKGASLERAAFLRDLLEFNNMEVKEMIEPAQESVNESLYTIGVTDLVFNPVFAVYECTLKTPSGTYVTPGYWNQECTQCDTRYWLGTKGSKKDTEES